MPSEQRSASLNGSSLATYLREQNRMNGSTAGSFTTSGDIRCPYQTCLRVRLGGPENLGYDVKRLLEYETRREMTVAAIALKRFELRHNKPAPDLTALVPEFLARVPHDYMDGGKLRYRLNTDGTWSLYSVGEDGVDNGGDPRPLEPRRLLFSIWDGRDAVWPQPAL